MNVNLHQVQPPIGQVPIEKLASNTQLSQKQKVQEVSRQFEAILLRQVLSEAQKPAFRAKEGDSSFSKDIYKDMLTNTLADQISRSGSIGLGRSLQTQLQHQLKTSDKPDGNAANGAAVPASHPKV